MDQETTNRRLWELAEQWRATWQPQIHAFVRFEYASSHCHHRIMRKKIRRCYR